MENQNQTYVQNERADVEEKKQQNQSIYSADNEKAEVTGDPSETGDDTLPGTDEVGTADVDSLLEEMNDKDGPGPDDDPDDDDDDDHLDGDDLDLDGDDSLPEEPDQDDLDDDDLDDDDDDLIDTDPGYDENDEFLNSTQHS